MKRIGLFFVVSLSITSLAFGWGSTGHKIINKNAVMHLPASMKMFIDQQSFLEAHSTDPDTRRNNSDTAMFSEQYRHYLDVDDYPNFMHLNRSFDTLVSVYGWSRVKENGTNPWTVVYDMDSLTNQLKRGDWSTAYQTAADLGHYIADPHQPLHAAANYDGKLTGNSGIHSRYESSMVNTFQNQITITKDSVHYIDDIYGFVFNYILHSNSLIDSIFHADNAGKAASGGSYNSVYYDTLWSRLGAMTKEQFQSSTIDVASLWYTAWVNAGLLPQVTDVRNNSELQPASFIVIKNFPNPFNPATTIDYTIPSPGNVVVKIYDIQGRELATLVDKVQGSGDHRVQWNAAGVTSGVYICRLQAGSIVATQKLVVLK